MTVPMAPVVAWCTHTLLGEPIDGPLRNLRVGSVSHEDPLEDPINLKALGKLSRGGGRPKAHMDVDIAVEPGVHTHVTTVGDRPRGAASANPRPAAHRQGSGIADSLGGRE